MSALFVEVSYMIIPKSMFNFQLRWTAQFDIFLVTVIHLIFVKHRTLSPFIGMKWITKQKKLRLHFFPVGFYISFQSWMCSCLLYCPKSAHELLNFLFTIIFLLFNFLSCAILTILLFCSPTKFPYILAKRYFSLKFLHTLLLRTVCIVVDSIGFDFSSCAYYELLFVT